jgi:hypothetical protein
MVLFGFACNTLNFAIIVRWWLIFQKHLDWVHPIIYWLLFWLVDYHQILLDCFIDWFYWLDRRLMQLFNNDIRRSWCPGGSNPC